MRATRDGVAYGAAMILGGMAVLGVTDNLVRLIAGDASLWQFHAMRSAMALPLLALGAAVLGLSLRPRSWRAVAARSAIQTAAMFVYFGALATMPIAQVGAALFTAPLWVLLIAALMGKRVGRGAILAVAVGFAGVLVMLRPDPETFSAWTLLPVAAGAVYGLSNVVTREWCAEEPAGVLAGGFFAGLGLVSLVVLGLLAVVPAPEAWRAAHPFFVEGWRAPDAPLLGWIFVQAAGSLVAVAMIARGYQSGETSRLAPFEYSFLLTASFWAWVLWGEALAPLDFLGIAMIVVSGAIVAAGETPRPAPGAAAE
jgi:drug/metabolite transporter (DMT)-like permease